MKSIVFLICFFLCVQVKAQKEIAVESSASAYPLNILQPDGSISTVAVAEKKGKVIVLQWWADQCEGSEDNLKSFNAISGKFKDQALFYAVSYDQLKNIQAFAQKNKFNFDFLRDKIQWSNEYFPSGPASHLVIIDSLGKCIYRGSPYLLNDVLMEALVKTNRLPDQTKFAVQQASALKTYHNRFKIPQGGAGFKLKPYNSALAVDANSTYSTGLYYYAYNNSIYRIYKDGLELSDYQIKLSDSLKKRLSSLETANLFSVGFQLKERGVNYYTSFMKPFIDSLNSAFKLNSRLVLKDDSVLIIQGIKEGPFMVKSLQYNTNSHEVKGDTLMVKGANGSVLSSFLSRHMNIIFISTSTSTVTYDGKINVDFNSINRKKVQAQLAKQGIECEVKLMPYYFLEFY